VLERGKTALQAVENQARELGIVLEITAVESEDIFATSLSEAQRGYDRVFLPKQQRKMFPLLKRTLEDYLQRKLPGRIVSC